MTSCQKKYLSLPTSGATNTIAVIRSAFDKKAVITDITISDIFFISEVFFLKNAKNTESTVQEDMIPKPLHSVATK